MTSERMRRVNESIRAVVSDAIPGLKDPRIGFVTVTGVETTSDIAQATIWVSVLGSDRARQRTLDALTGAAGVLQGAINRELHLRRTPHLTFAYDPSVERGVRLTKLIDELAPTDDPSQADDDGDD